MTTFYLRSTLVQILISIKVTRQVYLFVRTDTISSQFHFIISATDFVLDDIFLTVLIYSILFHFYVEKNPMVVKKYIYAAGLDTITVEDLLHWYLNQLEWCRVRYF